MTKAREFFDNICGKRVAICGIGNNNLPVAVDKWTVDLCAAEVEMADARAHQRWERARDVCILEIRREN